MTKYKIVLDREGCIGAFSCTAIAGGEDVWDINDEESKVDLKIPGASKSPELHEVVTEDEELVKKAIESGEVCPVLVIKVINLETGENLVENS